MLLRRTHWGASVLKGLPACPDTCPDICPDMCRCVRGRAHPAARVPGFAPVALLLLAMLAACACVVLPPVPEARAMMSAEQDDPNTIVDDGVDRNLHHAADVSRGDLPEIRRLGILRVLVAYAKGDFFIADGETRGVEADLAKDFAAWLSRKRARHTPPVQAIFIPVPFDRLLDELEAGRGDIAAASLTITASRTARVPFTTPYLRGVDEVFVARRGAPLPTRMEDLAGRTVHALSGSSHEEHLRALDARLKDMGLEGVKLVTPASGLEAEDLFAMLDAGAIDLVAADRHRADLWTRIMPGIQVAPGVVLHGGNDIGWAVRPGCPELLTAADAYFAARGGKALNRATTLVTSYYRSPEWRDNPLGRKFKARADALWPHFSEYGEQYGFDAFLLLAQGFRESGLQQSLRSPRGAVGVMQVLPSTAALMGVKNVVRNARANIHAGVRYMDYLRDDYFSDPELREPDRTLFSLAAYNMGPNRLMRVREKAARMGLDRNRWFGNVEYAALRYVGQEPVRYVSLISAYHMAYKGAAEQYLTRRALMEARGH